MRQAVNPQVLYLSYDGLTDPLGQSQILPYLTGLSADYSITIISFEKRVRFKNQREAVEKICSEYGIHWAPQKYHKWPPILSTMYDVWRLYRKTNALHKRYNFRIVHCRSYITSLIGLSLKRRYGIKFIFDMRGFWADERVDGGLWNLKNPLYKTIYRYFKRKEILFLKESDHIVALTENAKTEILSWNVPTSVTVIPCCVDAMLFDPARYIEVDKEKLRKELRLSVDDYIVLYLGSLGTWYMVDEMLKVFSLLKKENPNAKFLMVTPDSHDFGEYSHRESIIMKSVLRDDVPLYISIAHVAIFFIKPAYSKKASSPTKIGELLAMNIPVICNEGWGDVSYYATHLNGIRIMKQGEEELQSAISGIDPKGNREWALQHLSLAKGVVCYKNVYHSLL